MLSASAVRSQIEASLAHRIPAALTPASRSVRPVVSTGMPEVDTLLGGGLPVGSISELIGPVCSGRTSVALSCIARITRAGRVCAWIDVSNMLDPESAAAAGIDLQHLLWVRCGVTPNAKAQETSPFRLPEKYLDPPSIKKGLHGGGFGPHPRTEGQGLSAAVSQFLHPPIAAPRCAEPQPRRQYQSDTAQPALQGFNVPAKHHGRPLPPLARIEQALRVTDLLLQAGGFAAIVLDMAGIAPEHANRIPLASWFRYRAAAERTQTCLLLLEQHACAKSSGEVLLRFQPASTCSDDRPVFAGLRYQLHLERRRFTPTTPHIVSIRKPPQSERSTTWHGRTAWAGAR